ncbi:MAG: hypothetical protein WC554_04040 [Clostridia bacterium]|jgi:hypothetical protein
MSVEEVNVPPKVTDIPVKSNGPPDHWSQMAEQSKKQLEVMTNQKMMERLAQGDAPPPDNPIKMQGSINLGNIDFQATAREAQERADKIMMEREKEVKEERVRREAAEQEATKLRIDALQTQIQAQMAEMAKMIQLGMQKPKSFMEQYNEVKQLTTELGTLNPAPQAGAANSTFQLEMLKIQAQMAREEREFKREMRNDEKKWNLEIEKLNIERQANVAKLQADKEHQEFLANSIKGVGGAIAAGLLNGGGGGFTEESPAGASPLKPAGGISGQPKQSRQYRAEAKSGEAGELTCPTCQQPIGIGPETTRAICGNCGSTVDVTRTA